MPRRTSPFSPVMCDESGHTKFPFSHLEHVTLPTLAQARPGPLLRICSGLPHLLLTLTTIFGRLATEVRSGSQETECGKQIFLDKVFAVC